MPFKIIVKTLNGKQLPLDIEGEWTVRAVKEAIETNHGMAADTLKLIAYGKVLDKDENSAASYNLKENDFVVAMTQKAKPKPKAPVAEPTAVVVPPVVDATQPPV